MDAEAVTGGAVSITRAICADACDYRQPGSQSRHGCLAGIQDDFHGYTLHDFCEVAGRIVRRQQRELRAAGGSDLIDLSLKNHSGKGIHADGRWIPHVHMAYLRFFVVGLNPNIALNERDHLRPGTHQLAGAHLAFADESTFRRCDARIAQIEASQRSAAFLESKSA